MSENTKPKAKKGEPERFLREVVLPFASSECLVWPFTRPQGRYGTIRRGPVKRYVHILVCEMVHGMPPSHRHQASHSCGNGFGGCVNPLHLRWATSAENNGDKARHGTVARGERNGSAKLSETQVAEILATKPGDKEAKKRFGISRTQYFSILRGDSWSHVHVL